MKYIKKYESININKLNDELIRHSTHESSYNYIKNLLNAGADPNCEDSHTNSPLHYATINFNYSIIKLLVEYGADVNKKNAYNATPFNLLASFATGYHYSKNKNKIQHIADLLIDNGAEIDTTSNNSKYFDEIACDTFTEYIKYKYPEKYNNLLIKKEANKYNL